MKKKLLAIGLLFICSTSLTGCLASLRNQKALHGSYLTSDSGKYVILNESGGQIMDCWILDDTNVESDGITFPDLKQNGIMLQGDSKVMRLNSPEDVNKYVEYHRELDLIPYEEYYKEHVKQ